MPPPVTLSADTPRGDEAATGFPVRQRTWHLLEPRGGPQNLHTRVGTIRPCPTPPTTNYRTSTGQPCYRKPAAPTHVRPQARSWDRQGGCRLLGNPSLIC